MIDALGPMSESPDKGASRLQRSVQSVREGPRRKKAYVSVEDMIAARLANSDLSPESARLICERSIRQVGDHFEWTNDPALYWVSPVLLTESQIHDYLQHIRAGVLTLTATPYAPYVNEEKVKSRTSAIPHGRHLTVEGHHHFHMDQPETTARLVKEFILEQDELFADSPGNRP
jgi:pimeloyl-ACP methyl ester carboxylesterase